MFFVREGGTLTIVASALDCLENSNKVGEKSEHALTPKILRLRRINTPGVPEDQYEFALGKTGVKKGMGFIVFIPDGIKPGEVLVFKWVDENCACATALESPPGKGGHF